MYLPRVPHTKDKDHQKQVCRTLVHREKTRIVPPTICIGEIESPSNRQVC